MLGNFPMSARIAASDIGRARAWYADKLGLEPEKEAMGGTGHGGRLGGDRDRGRDGRSEVPGVTFEDYDFGEMKTVNGLLTAGDYRVCWFKDCEGNVIELTEAPAA